MATVGTIQPTEPIEPKDPIDPNYCPTCLSGTPPRDPWYEEAIGDPAVG